MSHFKLSGQPERAKLTLEVSIVTEFRDPPRSVHYQTTVNLKQTQTLQKIGESVKVIQVMEMNWNEMIKFT